MQIKKPAKASFLFDAPLGFEPKLTASKAAVLPLDDGAVEEVLFYHLLSKTGTDQVLPSYKYLTDSFHRLC
ncbi:MAG: hypothetical protein QG639_463 [Patescibacteria group bacterium]|nr:hypothetical protein [Patescibacteria group bacterium]